MKHNVLIRSKPNYYKNSYNDYKRSTVGMSVCLIVICGSDVNLLCLKKYGLST